MMWIALRDAKRQIRQCAIEILQTALISVKERDTRMKKDWFAKVYEAAQKALKLNASTESLHGALLVLSELLVHTDQFLLPRYKVCVCCCFALEVCMFVRLKLKLCFFLPCLRCVCVNVCMIIISP